MVLGYPAFQFLPSSILRARIAPAELTPIKLQKYSGSQNRRMIRLRQCKHYDGTGSFEQEQDRILRIHVFSNLSIDQKGLQELC